MLDGFDRITKGIKAIKKATNNDKQTHSDDIGNNNKNTLDTNDMQSSTIAKYADKNSPQHHHPGQPQQQKSIGFASDIGLVRSTDEDSLIIMDLMTAFEGKKRRKVILILADGMGGHNKGEVASKIGTRIMASELQQFLADADMNKEKYDNLLTKAFLKANSEILDYSEVHPQAQGMGTTISVAVMDESRGLYIGNVGDSRVYIISRDKGAIQLTKDHTFVQELVDKGNITKEEARHHPKKSVLNQAVGSFADITVDTFSRPLEDDDYVLLCCDGLVNHLTDEEIAKVVLDNNASPQVSCDKLVAYANKEGGKDNISVIIAPARIMKP